MKEEEEESTYNNLTSKSKVTLWITSIIDLCFYFTIYIDISKMAQKSKPLVFNILAECNTSKARVAKMILPHGEVDTPVFMPVGTQVYKLTRSHCDANKLTST